MVKITTKEINALFSISKAQSRKAFIIILTLALLKMEIEDIDSIEIEEFGIVKLRKRKYRFFIEFQPNDDWQKIINGTNVKNADVAKMLAELI